MTRWLSDRRTVLKTVFAAPVAIRAGLSPANAMETSMFGPERLYGDVKAYAEAGNKQSGGDGDRWTADWAAGRLEKAGFLIQRQSFQAPWFCASRCELRLGDLVIELTAQPLGVPTPPEGLSAPLRLVETPGPLDGAIALIRLPYRRWSTIVDQLIQSALADALERGAIAIVLVTTGPSGEALLLNVPPDRPVAQCPLAILAPRLAAPAIEAARHRRNVELLLLGEGGTRPTVNLIGRIERPGRRWIVVSTPRSGWTDCAGERGPGIAIWLALADWAPRAFSDHSFLFVASSGHEYENLGADHLVDEFGPPPLETDFWLHLGANAATRDWHEIPGRLLPLPSADPNRFLMTSPDLVERARQIFKSQPGLEMAYSSGEGTAGELTAIVKAGYPHHAGVFGAHRHHHAPSDTISTVAAEPLAVTASGFRDLLLSTVSAKG